MRTIVNILAFAALGLLLINLIGTFDWEIEGTIYKIVGILVVVAAILKGVITTSGGDDSEN